MWEEEDRDVIEYVSMKSSLVFIYCFLMAEYPFVRVYLGYPVVREEAAMGIAASTLLDEEG